MQEKEKDKDKGRDKRLLQWIGIVIIVLLLVNIVLTISMKRPGSQESSSPDNSAVVQIPGSESRPMQDQATEGPASSTLPPAAETLESAEEDSATTTLNTERHEAGTNDLTDAEASEIAESSGEGTMGSKPQSMKRRIREDNLRNTDPDLRGTTEVPTTEGSTTEAPSTEELTTEVSTTSPPTTPVPTQPPTTPAPTTPAPTTPAPTTPAPTTPAPTTPAPTTPAPTTPAPTTPAPTTPAPTTPAPTTPAPTTPAPTTQPPTTPAPTTPAPTTPSPTQPSPLQAKANAYNADFASATQEIWRLMNQERARIGVPALNLNTSFQQAAHVRSREIVRSFGHKRPDGRTPWTALTEAGYPGGYAAENIACVFVMEGESSASIGARIYDMWKNSAGHYANIINPNYTNVTMEIYYVVEDGWVYAYADQLFTAP